MNDTIDPNKAGAPAAEADEMLEVSVQLHVDSERPGLSLLKSMSLVVGIPTLLAALYFGVLASDIYVSETRYAIRSNDRSPATTDIFSVISTSGVSASSEDAMIVRDYILSRDMLDQLQNRLDLRQHYSSETIDWASRLKANASEEEFLEYYRGMIDLFIESASDITVLRVRAFDAITAQRIAFNIVELSEVLINRWSERITEDTLRFVRKDLTLAEDGIRDASAAVTRFRNEFRSIDPGQETSAVLGIITGLEAQLADARAQLIETTTFMRSDSAAVQQLKAKVAALERQVISERERLAGESGTELTRLIDGYEPLILEQKLAEQRYSSALTSLVASRAEAQRKQRYLIPFVTPELPDEPVEPERLKNILTVFIGALLLYVIGALVVAAIRDHVER